jgi:hypothetical protein
MIRSGDIVVLRIACIRSAGTGLDDEVRAMRAAILPEQT